MSRRTDVAGAFNAANYYTKTQSDQRFMTPSAARLAFQPIGNYAPLNHNHDDIYYTKTQSDNTFAKKTDIPINVVTSAQLANFYTKTDTDNTFAKKTDIPTNVVTSTQLANFYTKTESDGKFAPLAHNHDTSYYTKQQVDTAVNNARAKGVQSFVLNGSTLRITLLDNSNFDVPLPVAPPNVRNVTFNSSANELVITAADNTITRVPIPISTQSLSQIVATGQNHTLGSIIVAGGNVGIGGNPSNRVRLQVNGSINVGVGNNFDTVIQRTANVGSSALVLTGGSGFTEGSTSVITPTDAGNGSMIRLGGGATDGFGGNIDIYAYGPLGNESNRIRFHRRTGQNTTALSMSINDTGVVSAGNVSWGNMTSANILSTNVTTSSLIATNANVQGITRLADTTMGSLFVTGAGNFGNTTVRGTLSAGASTLASANVTGNANVGGTLSAGASTLASANVTGNANIGGTLSAGASTLASANITGNTNIDGALLISGRPLHHFVAAPIRTRNVSYCMDVANNSNADGTDIRSWECNSSPAQEFIYNPQSRQIIHKSSGKCVSIPNGNTENGTRLRLFQCQPSETAQQFNLELNRDGYRYRSNLDQSKCIDYPQGNPTLKIPMEIRSCTSVDGLFK